ALSRSPPPPPAAVPLTRRPPPSPYPPLFRSQTIVSGHSATLVSTPGTRAAGPMVRTPAVRRLSRRPRRGCRIRCPRDRRGQRIRSEEHTSELQSRFDLVCRRLPVKKNGSRER